MSTSKARIPFPSADRPGHLAYSGPPRSHREDRMAHALQERLRWQLYTNCERAPEWTHAHLDQGRG